MKYKKPWYKICWVWFIIFGLIILSIVPFMINNLYIWGNTTGKGYYTLWGASEVLAFYGDVLSFIGTVILGAITVWQTKKANDIAELAEKNNHQFIKLQSCEYKPKLLITSFVGISMHKIEFVDNLSDDMCNEMVIIEMRTKDNEVFCGYSATIFIDNSNQSEYDFLRTYEIHFKFLGKLSVSNVYLNSVCFVDSKYEYQYTITAGDFNTSLNDKDEITYFINIVGNGKIDDDNFIGRRIIECKKMILNYKMLMADDSIVYAKSIVTKHLVRNPENQFNVSNVEMEVSSNFEITQEMQNNLRNINNHDT